MSNKMGYGGIQFPCPKTVCSGVAAAAAISEKGLKSLGADSR